MAFNDGDPIDAAQLGALETTLAELKARIPQLGSSTTNINIDGGGVGSIVVPKIYGGFVPGQSLVPGSIVSYSINYSPAAFTAKPTSVVVTPIRGGGNSVCDYYVVSSSVTASGAIINAYLPADKTAFKLAFYFLAIQHS
jgi:hypothetical protein